MYIDPNRPTEYTSFMKEKPKRELTRVGELVGRSLDKGYLGLAREMVRVFEVWEEAVGEYNAAKASPESIKGGRLTVIVASPAWIEHFGYYKAEFMRRINEAAGAPLVSEIVFSSRPDRTFDSGSSAHRPGRNGISPPKSLPRLMTMSFPRLTRSKTRI